MPNFLPGSATSPKVDGPLSSKRKAVLGEQAVDDNDRRCPGVDQLGRVKIGDSYGWSYVRLQCRYTEGKRVRADGPRPSLLPIRPQDKSRSDPARYKCALGSGTPRCRNFQLSIGQCARLGERGGR